MFHTHTHTLRGKCVQRDTLTDLRRLSVCVTLCVRTVCVRPSFSIYEVRGNVEVMTESVLFTARDLQFITLMNAHAPLDMSVCLCVRLSHAELLKRCGRQKD